MNQGVNNQMNQEKNKLNVLVIHGPNLNMLGKREPEIYGRTTLDEINASLEKLGKRLGLAVETFQSNHEGAIVDKIQKAIVKQKGLIINPAAYTHTSIAIRDALLLLDIPVIEIHISNIYKRESFRHKSVISDVATAQIAGFGIQGYPMALEALAKMIQNR
jgi:3-dehydroquinate dehydratase-2